MPVAQLPALGRGLRVNSYAGALFAHNFKRQQAHKAMRTHSTLRKDEWENLDRIVVGTGKELMPGVMDLRGGTGTLRTVSVATSIAQYSRMSQMPGASFSMNPLAEGERGRLDFTIAGVPIPFCFGDFQLDIRTLTASRQLGEGLDVSQAAEASYQVSLAWETMLMLGTPSIAVADRVGDLSTIYGYTTHPSRNTGSAPGAWDDAANGYVNIINTVTNMIAALRADRFYGPYWLYVSDEQFTQMSAVNVNTDRTAMSMVMANPLIDRVRNSPRLADGNVVLVDPQPRSVQWVEAFSVRPVEWDEKGGLGTNFRVIGAGAPLIKTTSDGQCGVAHFTGA